MTAWEQRGCSAADGRVLLCDSTTTPLPTSPYPQPACVSCATTFNSQKGTCLLHTIRHQPPKHPCPKQGPGKQEQERDLKPRQMKPHFQPCREKRSLPALVWLIGG